MKKDIPDKLYFKIGEVAKLAGVAPHVLRYWEAEFPVIKPKRASSNQRLYRKKDVQAILRIKTLLHEQGLTIAGAKKLLAQGIDPGKTKKKENNAEGEDAKRLKDLKDQLVKLQTMLESKKK